LQITEGILFPVNVAVCVCGIQ